MDELAQAKIRKKKYKQMLDDIELYRLALLRSIAAEQLNIANLKKKEKEKNGR